MRAQASRCEAAGVSGDCHTLLLNSLVGERPYLLLFILAHISAMLCTGINFIACKVVE
jgi:hypothetical protein